jgi:hypothetical protein
MLSEVADKVEKVRRVNQVICNDIGHNPIE